MTRFVTYDPEVAARLAQAVGVHRVELRDAKPSSTRKVCPALFDALQDPQRCGLMMPSSDEQVLVIGLSKGGQEPIEKITKKRAKAQQERTVKEIGSQPSGFLGLQDEPVFSEEPEDPPRSLWKQDE